MHSKDSLIVQLSPEVRSQLSDGPRTVIDAVLKREALLQDQIKHFISLRVQELRSYTQHLLEEHLNELRRAQQDRKDALAARSRPPLKSIVKRRASSSAKRVSFSTVPPKIEYYPSGDEQNEQDSQALESSDEDGPIPPQRTPMQQVPAALGSAVVVYEPSPDKPQMRAGQDFDVQVRQIPDQTLPSKPRTSGGYDFSKISDPHAESDTDGEPPQIWSDDTENNMPDDTDANTLDCSMDKPALPVFINRQSHPKPWRAQERQRQSTVLSFDDAIDDHGLSELDSEPEEYSGDITPHRPSSPSPPPPEASNQQPTTLTVGSAPIDIHTPLTKALDGDGGPNNFKAPYEPVLPPAAEELEVSTPPKDPLSDPYLPPMELDPANLSFSQRMEWEDRFKTATRPLNNSFTGKI